LYLLQHAPNESGLDLENVKKHSFCNIMQKVHCFDGLFASLLVVP